ncbi:hypothetical protein GCM10028801_06000 [Nocardioides maradonensis]
MQQLPGRGAAGRERLDQLRLPGLCLQRDLEEVGGTAHQRDRPTDEGVDPDGHEVRFYTTDHHTAVPTDGPMVIDDPVGTEAERERAYRSQEVQAVQ